jgi:hypothetical protein
MEKFTADNFKKGFLIDEELMAGITESESGNGFTAFIVRHTTGESLGAREFPNLFEAIRAINDIPRPWAFEAVSKCGSGNCGNGNCGKGSGGCKRKSAPEAPSSCSTGNCD